jgi:hypothetical protein
MMCNRSRRRGALLLRRGCAQECGFGRNSCGGPPEEDPQPHEKSVRQVYPLICSRFQALSRPVRLQTDGLFARGARVGHADQRQPTGYWTRPELARSGNLSAHVPVQKFLGGFATRITQYRPRGPGQGADWVRLARRRWLRSVWPDWVRSVRPVWLRLVQPGWLPFAAGAAGAGVPS